jgi:RHS repeat-associated protein
MSTDPVFMKSGGQYYWYHNDHLGTPQMMTTSSGTVVWKAMYSSFGKATVDPSSTVVNPLRFPGQFEDAETGLHYNWWRYFNPEAGRYLRIDPLRWVGGINFYSYALSNPAINIDPDGNFVIIGTVLVVGGTYTAAMALADLTIAVVASVAIHHTLENTTTTQGEPWRPNTPPTPTPGDKWMFCVRACQAAAKQLLKCPRLVSAVPCGVLCTFTSFGGPKHGGN